MNIRALSILLLLLPAALHAMAATQNSDVDQFIDCPLPVLEYTTGELGEMPKHLYADSVEWVVESYHLHPDASGMPDQYEGWVVLIQLIADGDAELDDHVMREDNLAQVKVKGVWMLQQDFEVMLCTQ